MAKQDKKRSNANMIFSVVIAVGAFLYFGWRQQPVDEPAQDPNQKTSSTVIEKQAAPIVPAAAPQALPQPSDRTETLPPDLMQSLNNPPPTLPEDLKKQLAEPAPTLPEDLKRQLLNPVKELPPDLKAQLEAPQPELPDDIKKALQTPPRVVTLDEVNNPDYRPN